MKVPKVLSIFLLTLVISSSACSSTSLSSTETPPTAPQPATATRTSTVLEPSPSPVESPTPEPEAESEQTVVVPASLRVIYLHAGNLWSWTETGENVMLTDTGDMSTVRLSEDGQLLAFMRGREVWTVRMDGMDARPLVTQKNEGGELRFASNGLLLAVSTADHIDVIDLKTATATTVISFPAISHSYYPEVIWSVDSSGFKTVIPPGSENGQAEFLFVFPNGKVASLAKFLMVPPSESLPFISPDGGYVIYVGKLGDGKESLYLMDSSGAVKPYGEPAEHVRASGWFPDARHFMYAWEIPKKTVIGNVTGKPIMEVTVEGYESIRWLNVEQYLALQEGNLYLGDINGGKTLIAEAVSEFDFAQ